MSRCPTCEKLGIPPEREAEVHRRLANPREHTIPVVKLPANPPRPWSPCSGPDCKHPSHGR